MFSVGYELVLLVPFYMSNPTLLFTRTEPKVRGKRSPDQRQYHFPRVISRLRLIIQGL